MTIHAPVRRLRAILTVLALTAAVLIGAATAAAATTYAVYHATDEISARLTPTAAPTNLIGPHKGNAINVQCQVIGQPVGAHGNTLYFQTSWPGIGTIYVPDAWTDSPHLAGQPPIAGIPMCGSTPAPPPASDVRPSVWIGSPIEGHWPESAGCPAPYPSDTCSLPVSHHAPYGGDFALDLQQRAGVGIVGQQVILYAAPQMASTVVVAKVDRVVAACASRVVAQGGYYVQVGLYVGGVRTGWVGYAHINPSVSVGQILPRWGAVVGTVGNYTRSGCWTGAHVHVEMFNDKHYACYNRSFAPYQPISRTNFVGYLGGNRVGGPRQGCP